MRTTAACLASAVLFGCGDPRPDGNELLARALEAVAPAVTAEAVDFAALDAALILAERAAAVGDEGLRARRDLCVGIVASRRADLAAQQARGPEAGPEAWVMALRSADAAHAAFCTAAERPTELRPMAVRNAERAWRLLEELRTEKAAADAARAEQAKARRDAAQRDASGDPLVIDLPDYLARLLEQLQAREEQKSAARATQRGDRASDVEKDW